MPWDSLRFPLRDEDILKKRKKESEKENEIKTENKQEGETNIEEKPKEQKNIVYVGDKPLQNYVSAAIAQLNANKHVIIKARGKLISKAVDIAEIVKRSLPKIQTKDIKLGTDELIDKYGIRKLVSSIEIWISNE